MKQNNPIIFRKNYNDKDSGSVFLICLLAPVVLAFLFLIIAQSIASAKGLEDASTITSSKVFVIISTVCNFLLYIAIYLVYNKVNKIEFSAIKPNFKMKWHTYLLVIGLGIFSLFGLQYFIGIFDNIWQAIGFPIESNISSIIPDSWGNYILCILLLAVLPAIGEELIFRGMILHGLRSRYGEVMSVVLSALMFALMHGSLQQLVYPFLLGLIMGWIVLRTGSLISSIILHFVNNFLVVTFSFLELTTGFSLSIGNAWWTYIVAIALFSLTFGVCYLIDHFYFKRKSAEKYEKTSFKTSILIYISLAVAGFIFLFNTVLAFVSAQT